MPAPLIVIPVRSSPPGIDASSMERVITAFFSPPIVTVAALGAPPPVILEGPVFPLDVTAPAPFMEIVVVVSGIAQAPKSRVSPAIRVTGRRSTMLTPTVADALDWAARGRLKKAAAARQWWTGRMVPPGLSNRLYGTSCPEPK